MSRLFLPTGPCPKDGEPCTHWTRIDDAILLLPCLHQITAEELRQWAIDALSAPRVPSGEWTDDEWLAVLREFPPDANPIGPEVWVAIQREKARHE